MDQVLVSIGLAVGVALIILFTIRLIKIATVKHQAKKFRKATVVLKKKILVKDFKPHFNDLVVVVANRLGEVLEEESDKLKGITDIKELVSRGYGDYQLIFSADDSKSKITLICIGKE